MITIFNRRELLITYDTQKQSQVRTLLSNHGIEYDVKVRNITSHSPMSAGLRTRTGTFGVNLASSYEYKIYVKKAEYERAQALMNHCG